MTELELIIKELDKIGTELFNNYGVDSYNIRCELHDIKQQLAAINYTQCSLQLIAFSKHLIKEVTQEGHEKVVIDFLNKSYPFNESFDDIGIEKWIFDMGKTIDLETENKENNIPITYSTIKRKIGWNRFAEETNRNVYAISTHGDYHPNEVFYVTEEQANNLGL